MSRITAGLLSEDGLEVGILRKRLLRWEHITAVRKLFWRRLFCIQFCSESRVTRILVFQGHAGEFRSYLDGLVSEDSSVWKHLGDV